MRNILAIMKKQWKDTLKNKPVLIQFIIFPIMAVIMAKFVKVPGMSPTYFIKMFAGMFVGTSPLVATSSILSEEKDAGIMCLAGGFTGFAALKFLMILAAGILTSILIGAAIGAFSKNQMSN